MAVASNIMALTPINLMVDSTRILVTGLSTGLSESYILQEFKRFGDIRYIRLRKNPLNASASISFASPESAYAARGQINGKVLFGSRVNVCIADFFPIKESNTNIFVKNIPPSVDAGHLEEIFKCFGKIVNSKISYDEKNQSRGYGFIMFEKREEADFAVSKGNNAQILNSILTVQHFVPKEKRLVEKNNLYVRGFAESFTQEELVGIMTKYGEVISVVINRANGICFGFVCFANERSAELAVVDLHGKKNELGFEWFVSKNVSKSERLIESQLKLKENEEKWMRTNLYVKNWPVDLNETQLKSVFSKFGLIDSVKILTQECLTLISSYPTTELRPTGQAFISFYDEKSVDFAIRQMRHVLVNNTPLQLYHWVPKKMLFKGKPKKPPTAPIISQPKPHPVTYFNYERFNSVKSEEKKRIFGEAIYQEIFHKYEKWTGKITGMIIELDNPELLEMMRNKSLLYVKAEEAMGILLANIN